MKNFAFILALFCISCCMRAEVYAQRNVELYSERTPKSGIDIFAKTNTIGSFTIFIHFKSLENTIAQKTYSTVINGSEKILSLNPSAEGLHVSCNYTYYHTRGYTPPKVDSSFVYRLPFSDKKTEPVKAYTLYNINQRYLNDTTDNSWVSWQFLLNQGDTIYAIRKGVVVETVDKHLPSESKGNISFHSERNSITVEHEDGTLSSYQVIEKGSLMVSVGDVVYPGTPLAKAGTFSINDSYQIRVHVYYPVIDKELAKNPPASKSVFKHTYYNPFFLTSEGAQQLKSREPYYAASSDELVQKEMTKKELKRIYQKK